MGKTFLCLKRKFIGVIIESRIFRKSTKEGYLYFKIDVLSLFL